MINDFPRFGLRRQQSPFTTEHRYTLFDRLSSGSLPYPVKYLPSLATVFITITLNAISSRVPGLSDPDLTAFNARYRTASQDIYHLNTDMARRPSTLWKNDLHAGRPASVPPESGHSSDLRRSIMSHVRSNSRPLANDAESIRGSASEHQLPTGPAFERNPTDLVSLDFMDHLRRSGPSVVKTRTGSVLSRGFILKTDHYPSGEFHRS